MHSTCIAQLYAPRGNASSSARSPKAFQCNTLTERHDLVVSAVRAQNRHLYQRSLFCTNLSAKVLTVSQCSTLRAREKEGR